MSNTTGYMPPQSPPSGPPPGGPPMTNPSPSTGSIVAQVLLGIVGGGLLLLAVMVGLGEAGILSMASDSCGSENKCSTAATVAMLGFSAGGPILVLMIVGILAIISAMRKFSGAGSVVAILWYGVVADLVCIVAGYMAATAIAPS